MIRSQAVSGLGRVVAVLSVVALLFFYAVPSALGDPPGNNGTVKIDGVAFDDHPNNEPHVGCVFQVDFYGYDEGDLEAVATFAVQPPTGNAVIFSDTIAIGEDAAGGGTDLDASLLVDLSGPLAAYEPHPLQGFHVKLTVNAEGSIGADVKHKVFWVLCDPPPPPTTTSTSTSIHTSSTSHATSTTMHTSSTSKATSTTVDYTSTSARDTSTTVKYSSTTKAKSEGKLAFAPSGLKTPATEFDNGDETTSASGTTNLSTVGFNEVQADSLLAALANAVNW